MFLFRRLTAALFLLIPLAMGPAFATTDKEPPILRGVHKVVFLGDSITQAGDYVVDIECWCLAHGFPLQFLNIGLASETASDLTPAENEWHHNTFGFGRPFVSERLARALQATRPDLLVACYGMNDATGLPATDEGLHRYETAMTKLREIALHFGAKRVLLCTPPIFDNKGPYRDNNTDHILKGFSDWLLSKRKEGWLIADIHTPMRQALDARRDSDPKFQFADDGIHPDGAGHWIMAQAILTDAFHAHVADVSSAEALFPSHGDEIRNLIRQRQDILFRAYMTKIGHHRPGVTGGPGMSPGPSVQEASDRALAITAQIDALLR